MRKVILDGRAQYVWRIQRYQVGLFLEIYNLTNHANFGNATGARNSSNFLIPTVTDDLAPRSSASGLSSEPHKSRLRRRIMTVA